jgi:predicted TPR repeat methyltransferase
LTVSDLLQKARALFLEGTAHFDAGRLEAAAASFEAARALAPERPSILANLGVTLLRLGRFADALGHLEASLAADPGQADALLAQGLCCEALGRWPQAAQALQKALALGGVADGPPAAEAWLALGRCRGRLGEDAAAMGCFERALAQDPAMAQAWSARGGLLRDAGRMQEAAQCFERAVELGADPELHRFYLAAVQGGAAPRRAPQTYVAGLFDQYAGDFETHLLEVLRYQGHENLLRPVLAQQRSWRLALDLGCGTGLCGRLLQGHAQAVDGVDVSLAMVESARACGVYRRVEHADLLAFLDAGSETADLVLAADVFIYVGALDAVFASVRRRLAAGGVFAFCVEKHEGPHDLQLLPSLRYAHAPAYLQRLALENGFRIRRQWDAPLREEQGRSIEALYCVLDAVS